MQVRETGLQLLASNFSPFLKIAQAFTAFHTGGSPLIGGIFGEFDLARGHNHRLGPKEFLSTASLGQMPSNGLAAATVFAPECKINIWRQKPSVTHRVIVISDCVTAKFAWAEDRVL